MLNTTAPIGTLHLFPWSMIFDIVEFYPSISEDLLKQALDYAKQHTTISEEDLDIIMHARKSLFNDDEHRIRKGDSPMFDDAISNYIVCMVAR